MISKPKVVIIILNYNSLRKFGEEAYKFLESIVKTKYESLDIVIVDNGSTDGSIDEIEKRFNQLNNIKIVRLPNNLGYAGGNNIGFNLYGHESKYVAFVNNDIEVEEDWLEKIIDIMEKDSKIAAAQPKILQLRNKELIDSLGGKIDRLGRAYDLFHGLKDKENIEKIFETFYARGAAIVIRSEIFKNLQGFDEDYFIYYEETDLCWRIRLLGYRIVTIPTSRVYHLGGGTTGKPTPEIIYLRRKNQLTTLLKNYSIKNILRYVPLIYVLYIGYALKKLILNRDLLIFKSYMLAILWNLRNLKKIIAKRRVIQHIRKVSDDVILKYMLEISEYNTLSSIFSREY